VVAYRRAVYKSGAVRYNHLAVVFAWYPRSDNYSKLVGNKNKQHKKIKKSGRSFISVLLFIGVPEKPQGFLG
jgi:hypothetical protein